MQLGDKDSDSDRFWVGHFPRRPKREELREKARTPRSRILDDFEIEKL